jgi:hypothetical protein
MTNKQYAVLIYSILLLTQLGFIYATYIHNNDLARDITKAIEGRPDASAR